ncbi:MAG: hypothetical protein KC589_02015 [Nanoarchaeota archaeon]|nr:hypothetical protein [Nanoarchaeota archaeon]
MVTNSIGINYKVNLGEDPIAGMREFSQESRMQINKALDDTALNLMLSKAMAFSKTFADIKEPEGYAEAFETLKNRDEAIRRFSSLENYHKNLPPRIKNDIIKEHEWAEKVVSGLEDWSNKLDGLEFLISIIGSREEDSHKVLFPFVETNGKLLSGYVVEKLMGELKQDFQKERLNPEDSLLYLPTGKSYAGLIGSLSKSFKKSELLSRLNPQVLYVSNGLKYEALGAATPITRKKRNKETGDVG